MKAVIITNVLVEYSDTDIHTSREFTEIANDASYTTPMSLDVVVAANSTLDITLPGVSGGIFAHITSDIMVQICVAQTPVTTAATTNYISTSMLVLQNASFSYLHFKNTSLTTAANIKIIYLGK